MDFPIFDPRFLPAEEPDSCKNGCELRPLLARRDEQSDARREYRSPLTGSDPTTATWDAFGSPSWASSIANTHAKITLGTCDTGIHGRFLRGFCGPSGGRPNCGPASPPVATLASRNQPPSDRQQILAGGIVQSIPDREQFGGGGRRILSKRNRRHDRRFGCPYDFPCYRGAYVSWLCNWAQCLQSVIHTNADCPHPTDASKARRAHVALSLYRKATLHCQPEARMTGPAAPAGRRVMVAPQNATRRRQGCLERLARSVRHGRSRVRLCAN
jgi:hypothetical protein